MFRSRWELPFWDTLKLWCGRPLALLMFLSSPCFADDQPLAHGHRAHPRVAVVLEGGGALGFAHVGVLKVLEEARIPVDFVTGASMGAIVGAAFASGCTIEEMETALSTTNWDDLFNESPERRSQTFRRKPGRNQEIYGGARIGIQDGGFVIPSALVHGQFVEPLFKSLFSKSPPSIHFDQLPVPFRAVAADIETGETAILEQGSLALAARASMSVPGFFSPVELDGRLLVDGGISNNFPVDVALERNPDVIIGILLDSDLRKRDSLTGPLGITAQVLDMLLSQTSQRGAKLMRDSDIILRPNIRAYSASSFNLAKEIMLAGEVAAREALPGLKHLAISESEFAKYYARRTSGDYSSPVIQELRFEGLSARHKYRLSRELALIPGQPLDRTKVDASLRAIFEEGELKRISYQVEEVGGQQILVIRSERKDWLRNQLRLGFSVQDDLDGGDSFSLGAEARFNDLHESGTYALVQLEMGQTSRLYSELVQPLSQQFPLFFSPSIELARRDISILKDGERVAEYERRNSTLGLDLGVSLGRFGEITSGWRWGEVDLSRAVGDPELVGAAYDVGEWVSQLSLDQFNDPDFPTEGYRVSLISTQARESLAGSENFDQLRGSVAVPLNYESFTLLLNAEAGMSSDGLPLGRSFTLGGPFDISGYPRSSLIADNFWVGRSIAFYRIAQGSSALFKLGGYVGTTLEVASLRTRSSTIGDERGLVAGSLFIGADTPLLPVYFGFGLSDTSESTLFLSIGRLAPRQR